MWQRKSFFVVAVALLLWGSAASAATTIGNNVSVGGTLTVTGLATFSAGFIADTSSTVSADLNVAGDMLVSSTLQSTGAARLYSTLTVDGIATVAGVSTTAGIYPSTNNTRDLGDFGAAFRSVYVSTSIVIGGNGSTVSSTAIKAHLSQLTAAINIPAAVSSTDCTSSSVPFPGVAIGDTVLVAPLVYDEAFMTGQLTAMVTSSNGVVLMYCVGGIGNGSDYDPASMGYRIDAWKH